MEKEYLLFLILIAVVIGAAFLLDSLFSNIQKDQELCPVEYNSTECNEIILSNFTYVCISGIGNLSTWNLTHFVKDWINRGVCGDIDIVDEKYVVEKC